MTVSRATARVSVALVAAVTAVMGVIGSMGVIGLMSVMCVTEVAGAPALTASSVVLDESLRATLVQMGRDDQEAIRVVSGSRPGDATDAALVKRIGEIHRRNGELIRSIVDEHGWPGRSLVGDGGASAAWIVVQHMDEDPAFQRRCLTLVEGAFIAGEVSAHDLAYLTDRVLRAEQKPQKYGTQGAGVTSPEDEARVDRNRAAIGLEPWRQFIEKKRKEYADAAEGPAQAPHTAAPPAEVAPKATDSDTPRR